jgi:hypothetical protein
MPEGSLLRMWSGIFPPAGTIRAPYAPDRGAQLRGGEMDGGARIAVLKLPEKALSTISLVDGDATDVVGRPGHD